jgi:hypothetical protein
MFRFTIRDVLWLTVVVGLAVGWFVEHERTIRMGRQIEEIRQAVDEIKLHTVKSRNRPPPKTRSPQTVSPDEN